MNFIYNAAVALYATAVRVASVRNRKAKLMVAGQACTFDILGKYIDRNAKYVWIHVSSLGEFEQGRPLIEMLKRRHPEKKILLTFFSPSGYEVCKNYQLADVICYLPFDCPSNVRRFLDAVDVETAIFVKYEFWGNYLQELRRRNIPTYIISAIFRPTQAFFKGYGGMFRKMLKCYTHLFVQDKESKDLLATIGVTNVEVFGDTRFDRVSDILDNKVDLPIVETFARGSFTVIAGSSWEPDEEFLISFFNRTPSMKLVLAPHELSEARVEGILSKLKRPAVRYSKATVEEAADADCLIIDCFGLLSKSYRYATVAYVGGGFGVGIHNINEAAVYGIPVVFGPKYDKFKEARDLIALGGAFSVNSGEDYAQIMTRMLDDRPYLAKCGKIAGRYIEGNLGATERIYNFVFNKK